MLISFDVLQNQIRTVEYGKFKKWQRPYFQILGFWWLRVKRGSLRAETVWQAWIRRPNRIAWEPSNHTNMSIQQEASSSLLVRILSTISFGWWGLTTMLVRPCGVILFNCDYLTTVSLVSSSLCHLNPLDHDYSITFPRLDARASLTKAGICELWTFRTAQLLLDTSMLLFCLFISLIFRSSSNQAHTRWALM